MTTKISTGKRGPKKKGQRARTKPPKGDETYRRLWIIVDGAVKDAFTMHQDYLTEKGKQWNTARMSIVKRVVGAIRSQVGKE